MSQEFEGKVALVTGASRGIGAAIADTLAVRGARVFGTATSATGATAIAQRLAGLDDKPGDHHGGLELNVNDEGSAETLVKHITELAGAPVILVNNAGITRDQLLMRMKDEDWDDVLNTNLRSVFRLSKACLRGMMKARFGRIVSIASVVGATGNPGQANYAAAKAGMVGFSKSIAREVASRNITVNVVAPGFIDTDMTRELSDEQRELLMKDIPMASLGSPQDIAEAVTYLASNAGRYLTGQTLHVNGGMYMP